MGRGASAQRAEWCGCSVPPKESSTEPSKGFHGDPLKPPQSPTAPVAPVEPELADISSLEQGLLFRLPPKHKNNQRSTSLSGANGHKTSSVGRESSQSSARSTGLRSSARHVDVSTQDNLRLPSSPEVREQLRAGGSSVTFLQVALAVVARLEESASCEIRKDELRFVRDCLAASSGLTQLSCALVSESNGDDVDGSVGALKRKSMRTSILCEFSDGPKPSPSPTNIQQSKNSDNGEKKVLPSTSETDPARLRGDLKWADSQPDQLVPLEMCPWMGPVVPRWPVHDLEIKDSTKLQQLLDSFNDWSFNIFTLADVTGGRPLLFSGWQALSCSGCFSEFPIAPEKAIAFLHAVEPIYATEATTPYHNNIHAADVTHTVRSLLIDIRLSSYFDPMDTLVSIISAIIHDLGHDGKNNAFHVSMQDQLALTYNDKSVLENFHLATAFKLLTDSQATNLFDGFIREQVTTVRKEVIDMVLGTDMSQHFSSVGEFSAIVNRLGRDVQNWKADAKAMYALRSMMLHTADISNQAKPFGLAYKWSMRCLEEFFAQGDEEKQRGLPISPLCNRDETDVCQSQLGFIEFIVLPSFNGLAAFLPRVEDVCLFELRRNQSLWKQEQERDALQTPSQSKLDF